ncbi:hypothetical protein pb186bvf_002241 [Paramecium bursaria]
MYSPLEQIQKLQLLLLKHDIHLFPQGFENSQEQIKELIQIIKDDQDFNDNLQREVNRFLALDPEQFKQVLDYETNFLIYKQYDEKILEYNQHQKRIRRCDIPNIQAFIHNYWIRDQDQVQLMEDIFVELNQYKAQADQEILRIDRGHIMEIKTLNCPPEVALRVAEMMIILLNNCTRTQNNAWQQFKRMLNNPGEFLQKMMQFQVEKVSINPIIIARNIFENINYVQCQRSGQFAYTMYKWSEYQFRIVDILNNFQIGIEDLQKHKQAQKFKENLQEIKQKIQTLEQVIHENKYFKKPQRLDKEDRAKKVLKCVRQFERLQTVVQPKQYGINIIKYVNNFLDQQLFPKDQIDLLLKEIYSDVFPNYTIFFNETNQQPYQYPLKLNNILIQNTNLDKVAQDLLLLIKNPISQYNNLKQLNSLINQSTLTEQINALVYQLYLNIQMYSEQYFQKILMLIHQFILLIHNQTEFLLHPILKILDFTKTERQCLMGLIKYIKKKCIINLQHQNQLLFKGIPLIDYLIDSYFEDNQNKFKLQFSQKQQEDIKEIIMKEKLDVDETIDNIIENYQIIQKSKEYYIEVSKGIENIQQGIIDNNKQSVILGQKNIEYYKFTQNLIDQNSNLSRQKTILENQLKILIDKDLMLKVQIDKSKQIQSKPIHHGIKYNELGFFKYLSKFNPISFFAAKITLIQLGIFTFTPDMIKKHLGSQTDFKRLTSLTINHLTYNQFTQLHRLLTDFNEEAYLSKSQTVAIQNIIKRPFRILHLGRLKVNNEELMIIRSDLLQKIRVIKNKLNIIHLVKIDLDQQVIQKLEQNMRIIRKEIEVCEESDSHTQKNGEQLKDIQQLQEFVNEFQSLDTLNLCIQLIQQSFIQPKEVYIIKQNKDDIKCLTQILYQNVPKGLLKEQSRFNLLLIYLQDQYKNNQTELKRTYENKGLFKSFKQSIVVDALSYWNYLYLAKTDINILIGIYSYQLFYNDFGHQVQAICIQPEHYLIDNQTNINYQIRALYEILHIKYGSLTLSVILQFLKQVRNVQLNISCINDILNYQINIEAQNEIEFKEFQLRVQEIVNCQIKEFVK